MMPLDITTAAISWLPHIRFADVIDILFVAFLLFELYRLVRKTNAIKIFWVIVAIYLLWRMVEVFNMHLSSLILGSIINIGLLAIVVVFQPEIRKFLLMLSTRLPDGKRVPRLFNLWRGKENGADINFTPYVQACMHLSASKTGALIIFKRQASVEELVQTGEKIDAIVSSALIEQVFYKNTPLHDGAMIVDGNRMLAARCILPVTQRTDIDPNLGLRHRSAIGVTETLDVISVVVSEETGAISYVIDGEIRHNVSAAKLQQMLEEVYHVKEEQA